MTRKFTSGLKGREGPLLTHKVVRVLAVVKFLQENTVTLEMSCRMPPLSSAGEVNAFVKWAAFFSAFLGSQESLPVDGLQVPGRIP